MARLVEVYNSAEDIIQERHMAECKMNDTARMKMIRIIADVKVLIDSEK